MSKGSKETAPGHWHTEGNKEGFTNSNDDVVIIIIGIVYAFVGPFLEYVSKTN